MSMVNNFFHRHTKVISKIEPCNAGFSNSAVAKEVDQTLVNRRLALLVWRSLVSVAGVRWGWGWGVY
jgi:hypothetical protein